MNKRKKDVTTILTNSPLSIETSCFQGSRILRGSIWRGTRVQSYALTTFSKHSQNRSVSVLPSEYKLKIRDQGNNMS